MSCDELTDYLHPILHRLAYILSYMYIKSIKAQLWAYVPCLRKQELICMTNISRAARRKPLGVNGTK